MEAITRPRATSIQANSGATGATETDPTCLVRSHSPATPAAAPIAASTYAQVQFQVWHWKTSDCGLDMP